MATVSVVLVAAYRQIWGSDWSVWSKGRQPPGTHAALARWTGWTLAVAVHCYDDSTINIVAAITNTITLTAAREAGTQSTYNREKKSWVDLSVGHIPRQFTCSPIWVL